MSKRYVHLREDLADTTALAAAATANPGSFPVGGMWITANGVVHVVTANDGTTVSWSTVGLTPVP